MAPTTHDILGNEPDVRPATPGSYGEAPRGFRLPATTSLGPVVLQISDLGRSLAFYEGVLGFHLLGRPHGEAVLGARPGGAPLIVLREHVSARPAAQRGRLGLYHFAILLPDRASLGSFARHLGETGIRAGAGDHLVSEAFYLADPDQLGIEVYADRPRESWRRAGRELVMATDPVDVEGLRRAAGGRRWAGMPADTIIGHVHLHVGDIATASSFFSESLGFDRTVWHYPGALFFSAGGYHHHLGTNTWAGTGATPAGPDDAQLLEWTIEVPSEDAIAAARDSLVAHRQAIEQSQRDALVIADPWGTRVRLRVRPAPASGTSP